MLSRTNFSDRILSSAGPVRFAGAGFRFRFSVRRFSGGGPGVFPPSLLRMAARFFFRTGGRRRPVAPDPLRRDDKKQARDTASLFSWRKVRDSNPRNHIRSSTDFESVPFDHSGNFPGTKIITSRIFDTPRRIFCIKSSLREDVRCTDGAGRRAASQGFCSGVRRGGGCRSGPAFVIF